MTFKSAAEVDFVSLAMLVQETPWRWPRDLHPFFRQNLPEGYLLSSIRDEFGPPARWHRPVAAGRVVGGNGIGRVTVTPKGATLGQGLTSLDIAQLLNGDNATKHFASLARRYAPASTSGMVPKFLAPQATDDVQRSPMGKLTLRTSRHIVKGSDENTLYLGFNEFNSMRVLERLNVVPVARTQMSDDGRVLIVDRIDVDAGGVPTHGLEDARSLLGLPPHEKYATTAEKVLNATRAYLLSACVRTQLERLGWHLLTNYMVRNADCHAQNISLYYRSLSDVGYTPVYNIVTTQAYPRYAANPPELSISGRKTWAARKTPERFFNARLGIAPRRCAEMIEQLCESAVEIGKEVIAAGKNEPRWHDTAKQMVHAWNDGVSSLRSSKQAASFKGLAPTIAEAGFSAPEAAKPQREVIGRCERLAPARTQQIARN